MASLGAVADHPAGVSVALLADPPQLVAAVGEMRWSEWGDEPGREDVSWWVDVTAHEAGRLELPVTWVAVEDGIQAAGAVGLGEFDIAERRDRSPWVLGMIVRPVSRGRGVGRLLLAELERFAVGEGYPQVWVATGGPAVDFYQRCGWKQAEYLPFTPGGPTTILTKLL